jgi:hypothetical protein
MKALRMLVLVLLAAALVGFAAPPATDCPPGSPDCPLEAPQTVEINPIPRAADGELAPVEEPGALTPIQAAIPMPPPTYVDVVALPEPAPYFETLDVGMRYQGEGDVSCGVQALGMALEGLGAPAPASSALLDFLQQHGMFYDFGTGVEELAYAAQAHGYAGAYAFHNWDRQMLADEIAAGHPVVAALGANGEGQPGHFVTVTGISPNGQWVAFNDPTLGEQRMRADEFAALWGLQGNSGVRVALDAPVTSAGEMDLLPWVALAAGAMALVTQFPWGQRREGVGGALAKDVTGEDVVRVVPQSMAKRASYAQAQKPRRAAAKSNSCSLITNSAKGIAQGAGIAKDAEGIIIHRGAESTPEEISIPEKPNDSSIPIPGGDGPCLTFCSSTMLDYGPCWTDAIFTLANGIGTLLVLTGVASELGVILLSVNFAYQAVQLLQDFSERQRGEISQDRFEFKAAMNILDAIPGLGVLSGIFGLIDSCISDWAFSFGANDSDGR